MFLFKIIKFDLKYYDIMSLLEVTKGLSNDKFAFLPFTEEYSKPFNIPEIEEYCMTRLMFET